MSNVHIDRRSCKMLDYICCNGCSGTALNPEDSPFVVVKVTRTVGALKLPRHVRVETLQCWALQP